MILAIGLTILGQMQHTTDANGKRAGHSVASNTAASASRWIGKQAPGFDTIDAAGKKTSLKKLLGKPVVLVFIEKDCPCCKGGRPYFDRIQRKYGDVANIVGVVVGSVKTASNWKAKSGAEFIVVSDPRGEIIKKYGVTSSLFTAVIGTNGKVVKAYPGYSAPMLKEVSSTIAHLANVKDRKMETRPAPEELTSGCSFKG